MRTGATKHRRLAIAGTTNGRFVPFFYPSSSFPPLLLFSHPFFLLSLSSLPSFFSPPPSFHSFARMTKNPAPKRLMLPWVGEPRIGGGQEMTYGRSLERHLKRRLSACLRRVGHPRTGPRGVAHARDEAPLRYRSIARAAAPV